METYIVDLQPDDNSIPTARMLDNLKARLSDHGYWKPSFRMDVTYVALIRYL
jgi:hypothetical protein